MTDFLFGMLAGAVLLMAVAVAILVWLIAYSTEDEATLAGYEHPSADPRNSINRP
jgi:hypothetical protein